MSELKILIIKMCGTKILKFSCQMQYNKLSIDF